ncbi:MAG: hypothetical protein KKH52_03675, partial [Nanoarchaeota archaeon]|nr:hypothetical protein [Nanoarchaeota archaeon]
RWYSEMLPLSYDLAMEIQKFRRLMEDKLDHKQSKTEIKKFINEYLYVDEKAAESIYRYFNEQYQFSYIPSDKRILIEKYTDRGRNYFIFSTLFGRRVNDCLSRALAYVIGKQQKRDVEIGISDNGFYLSSEKNFNVLKAFEALQKENFREILEQSVERSEVLQRRFRHCAGRSLMILRQYMGRKKSAGRMQMGSKILFNAVKRISNDFPILKEARREVLEDLMDVQHAEEIIEKINNKKTELKEIQTQIPSPFSFGLITAGYSDVIKIEDKQEFLRRMHQMVLAKIALKEGKKIPHKDFSYPNLWEKKEKEERTAAEDKKDLLKQQAWNLKRVPGYVKNELVRFIEFERMRDDIKQGLRDHKKEIEENWPEELKEFVLEKITTSE